jgi:hypothetical protein
MFKLKQLLFPLITILFWCCNTNSKYGYSIKDFRKSLQPALVRIVSKGIAVNHDSPLSNMATDKELIQLGQSEHPVLRASAFREMLERESFNHFDILMNHLDDTAMVATEAGEWGIWKRSVSDYLIEEAVWKNTEDKNKTIDEVITKHNYLRSAYMILERIKPQEKYYTCIKDMAIRERKSVDNYNTQTIEDFEYALYGLAKFKKKEDIQLIKTLLLSNNGRMNELSFRLMKEFPDTAYLEVYENYYPTGYYQSICRNGSSDKAIDFINSIAGYKNDRSAKILETILNRKPFARCLAEPNYLKEELIRAIADNKCEAYLKLRKQVEVSILKYEKNKIALPSIEPSKLPTDKADKITRWWY